MKLPEDKDILRGDIRAVARAIRAVEDGWPGSRALLTRLFPHAGRALTLGITGPPGAGKSTLVDRLTTHFRKAGKTVGVVAVDPTSPFSGGAILGDRIRMQSHATDDGVFIRSMATRGAPGRPLRRHHGRAPRARRLLEGHPHRRDRRRRPGRGRHRHGGGHRDRGPGARSRRRGPGPQGRHHGDRGPVRGQQGRPRRRRPPGLRNRDDAVAHRRDEGRSATRGSHRGALEPGHRRTREDHRRGPGPAGTERAAAARRRERLLRQFEAQVEGLLREKVRRRIDALDSSLRLRERVQNREIDPYSAADETLEGVE